MKIKAIIIMIALFAQTTFAYETVKFKMEVLAEGLAQDCTIGIPESNEESIEVELNQMSVQGTFGVWNGDSMSPIYLSKSLVIQKNSVNQWYTIELNLWQGPNASVVNTSRVTTRLDSSMVIEVLGPSQGGCMGRPVLKATFVK